MAVGQVSETEIHSPEFWNREIEESEACPLSERWREAGERVMKLASRQLEGTANQRKDLVDITGSVAATIVSDLVYQDPTPKCKAWPVTHRRYEVIWEKLLTRAMSHTKLINQINAIRFLIWGLSGLKRFEQGSFLGRSLVKGQNVSFDKDYLEEGAEPIKDSRWIREKILMPLSMLRARARAERWNAGAVQEVADKYSSTNKPDTMISVWINEIHFKDKNGNWRVLHHSEEATSALLEKPKKSPIIRPSLALMRAPGDHGIETGVLSRIREIDERFNIILRKACERAENRGGWLGYDVNALTTGVTIPGRGRQKSGAEKKIFAGKKGVAILPVNLKPGQKLRDVIDMIGAGEITREEMAELEFLWRQVRLTTGAIMERLGALQKGGETTATESKIVAGEREKVRGLSTNLVDDYLEQDIYNLALWMRLLWVEGQKKGREQGHDWFMDILDDDEYAIMDASMPAFSTDLHEFTFSIEPGSTQKLYNELKMQKLVQLFQFVSQGDVRGFLVMSGKRFRIDKLLEQLFRLAELGRVEEFFEDMTQEEIMFEREMEGKAGGEGGAPGIQGALMMQGAGPAMARGGG